MAQLDVTKLVYGYGSPELHEKLILFLNRAFDFESGVFEEMHPKLYNPEREPWKYNYMARDEENIYAAVGVYENVLHVGEDTLRYRGIGNVAVGHEARNLGLMKKCMTAVLNEMAEDNIDFACLGGHRQRYAYYGFQRVGTVYKFKIVKGNVRHIYGNAPFTKLEFREVTAKDTEILDKIYELNEKKPVYSERPREILYDIMITWNTKLYAVLKDNEFLGYFLDELRELNLIDINDFDDVIRNYMQEHDEVEFCIAPWQLDYVNKMNDLYENYNLGLNEMVHVFNYRRVVETLLKFKSKCGKLADGELKLWIHGFMKDEKLKITVADSVVNVEEFEGDCDMELSHAEAMQLLFGQISSRKAELKGEAHSWFPLPIYMERADQV